MQICACPIMALVLRFDCTILHELISLLRRQFAVERKSTPFIHPCTSITVLNLSLGGIRTLHSLLSGTILHVTIRYIPDLSCPVLSDPVMSCPVLSHNCLSD